MKPSGVEVHAVHTCTATTSAGGDEIEEPADFAVPFDVVQRPRAVGPEARPHAAAGTELTGETLKGDGLNALFDRMPEDTLLCITMVVTPQDMLEGHLAPTTSRAAPSRSAVR